MAPMTKKQRRRHHGQKQSQNQRGKTAKSWSRVDLPRPLLNTIRSHPLLAHNLTFGVTTKSWRSKPALCSPSNQLQLLHTTQETPFTWFSVAFPGMSLGHWRYYRRELNYWNPWTCLFGYSHDVSAQGGPTPPSEVYLWNPVGPGCLCLLPWDCQIPFKRVVLSSPHAGCSACLGHVLMVVTGMSRPAFVFCDLSRRQPGDLKWFKYDCNVEDPNCGNSSERRMEFTNAVSGNGKFYALSSQGTLAVLEYSDSGTEIVALCSSRAVPNAPWRRSFRECLLEIEGEVLLVFLVSRTTAKVVDGVEVLRLRVNSRSWTKASNIGDRALFMGANCCLHVLVSEEGWCSRNCIYFVQKEGEDNVWWVFDMERSCISRCWKEVDCPVGLI